MTETIIPNPDEVLAPADAARQLGISKITLLRMRKQPDAGGLPFVKLSPHRLGYIRRDVLAFLAARRIGALPAA